MIFSKKNIAGEGGGLSDEMELLSFDDFVGSFVGDWVYYPLLIYPFSSSYFCCILRDEMIGEYILNPIHRRRIGC